MMTADSLRLTAYGPDEDEMRIVEDLPKAKMPAGESGRAHWMHPAHLTRHARRASMTRP